MQREDHEQVASQFRARPADVEDDQLQQRAEYTPIDVSSRKNPAPPETVRYGHGRYGSKTSATASSKESTLIDRRRDSFERGTPSKEYLHRDKHHT